MDPILARLKKFRAETQVAQRQVEEYAHESPFNRTKRVVQDELARAESYRVLILKNVTTFCKIPPSAVFKLVTSPH
jgi:hypothetical protein